MEKIIAKPHLFFFGLAPIFFIIAFLVGNTSLDIAIYDTYFTITYTYLFTFLAIFFAMIGMNYYALKWAEKPPKKALTVAHIFLQFLALFLLITANHWNWIGNSSLEKVTMQNDNSNTIIAFAFIIFFISIFVHILNFFVSLILKRD